MHHPAAATTVARSFAIIALALVTVSAAAGCASQPSISSWQTSLTRYVRDQGRGDPTVLRDMTLPGDRPGFNVIGHHDTRESVDVNGVLLGHERVGNRTWFVYLVGLVQKERVADIRLAAVSWENDKATWKRGKGSKQSLNAYRSYGEKQAKERFPDRRKSPPRYMGFPRPDDAFKLNRTDAKLVATHEASGARWELLLSNRG